MRRLKYASVSEENLLIKSMLLAADAVKGDLYLLPVGPENLYALDLYW